MRTGHFLDHSLGEDPTGSIDDEEDDQMSDAGR